MSPGNDEGRPRQGDRPSSNSSTSEATRPLGLSTLATHLVATAVYVTSPRSGRGRYLLAWRCPVCGTRHLSTVRVPAAELIRNTPCVGRTVLHVAGIEAAA